MAFYFPLNLGDETTPSARDAHEAQGFQRSPNPYSPYDAWREGVETHRRVVEPNPENHILGNLLLHDKQSHTTVIVGEPGSGKTRLLEQWLARGLHNVAKHGINAPLPVLVRLRQFNGDAVTTLHS